MKVFEPQESIDGGEECVVNLADGSCLTLFTDGEGLHIGADHRIASTVSCYGTARMLVFVAKPE